MKHKDKEALKNAFGIPEPLEADTFFERPEFAEVKEKRRRALLFHRIPAALRYGTIAVAAAAVIGVWGGFRNWAKDDKFPANEITATEETNTAEAATGSEDTTSTAPEGNGTDITVTTTQDGDIIVTTVSSGDKGNSVTTVQTEAAPGVTGRTTTAAARPSSGRTTAPSGRTTAPSGRTTAPSSGRTTRTTAVTTGTSVIRTTAAVQTSPSVVTTTQQMEEGHSQWPVVATTSQASKSSRDNTVEPDVVYDVHGTIVDCREFTGNAHNDPEDKVTDPVSPMDPVYTNTMDLEGLVYKSDLIVSAKVEKVIYTSENGFPVTQSDIVIENVYSGGMNSGDKISVRSSGGYMPVNEYEPAVKGGFSYKYPNAFVFDNRNDAFMPEEGDRFVFFLVEDEGIYKLSSDNGDSVFHSSGGYLISESSSRDRTTFMELVNTIARINDERW